MSDARMRKASGSFPNQSQEIRLAALPNPDKWRGHCLTLIVRRLSWNEFEIERQREESLDLKSRCCD